VSARPSPEPKARLGAISFLDAMQDPALFGPWFKPESSWAAWRVFAKALFGLALDAGELDVFARHTGRSMAPASPFREAWVPVGRRGGKSIFAAALAVYMATFRDYRPHLKPGERAVVMVLAADKDQAGVVFDYIAGFFDNVPMLAGLVEKRGKGKESIKLRNRVTIRVQVASFRRLRGRTVAAAILDEVAFWYSDEESRNPDTEILKALRPSMATIPGSLLIAISSPYAKRGILWDAYRRYFGNDGARALVWKADTVAMNPSVDRQVIDEAYEEDPLAAAAEYGAEFRDDIEAFVTPEVVERATVKGRLYVPFEPGHRYVGFVDPAGGSGQDSMTLAIARRDGAKAVLCRVVEWKPPFSPDAATAECCQVLKEYGLATVIGDNYAASWPVERFRHNGVRYVRSDKAKSDIYLAFLPLLNSQRVELLDHARTNRQLLGLERSKSNLGRETITHQRNAHDDLINSASGALILVARPQILEGYGAPAPATAQRQQQEGSVRRGIVTHYYAGCRNGHQYAVLTKEEAEREQPCAQEGWSVGPWGPAYYGPGRRTLE
jgi:hypothetical protein